MITEIVETNADYFLFYYFIYWNKFMEYNSNIMLLEKIFIINLLPRPILAASGYGRVQGSLYGSAL